MHYEFLTTKLTYQKATETCREAGGHLPSFHNLVEHRTQVQTISKPEYKTCSKWFVGV